MKSSVISNSAWNKEINIRKFENLKSHIICWTKHFDYLSLLMNVSAFIHDEKLTDNSQDEQFVALQEDKSSYSVKTERAAHASYLNF